MESYSMLFDAKGHKLAQEECTDWRLLDESDPGFKWTNYQNTLENIRSRLTHTPKAHRIRVVRGKGPAQQHIELFDKQGMLIATTHTDCWGLKEGDSLSQEAIKELGDYVRNPAILSSLKVSEVKPLITVGMLVRSVFPRK